MKTVLRNEQGEITHIHYDKREYLPKDQHQIVTETEVTDEMVQKAGFVGKDTLLTLLANEVKSVKALKLEILILSGVLKKYNPEFI